MKKYSAVSARIPTILKKMLAETVEKYGYVNESDFIREAIRIHIYAVRDKNEEVSGKKEAK